MRLAELFATNRAAVLFLAALRVAILFQYILPIEPLATLATCKLSFIFMIFEMPFAVLIMFIGRPIET